MEKNIKDFLDKKVLLFLLNLKEEKKHNLDLYEESDNKVVFVFKNKNSLYEFLTNRGIDLSNQTLKDIADSTLIMHRFESGELLIQKNLLKHFIKKVTKNYQKNNNSSSHNKKLVKI